jgi:3-mercaptopyruvate sulfurtransferase SseA
MIDTFYGRGTLDSPAAFIAALLLGVAFGFLLERAGFGSSRKLAGVFYFRDMTVIKVMFSALLTAMIGLGILQGLGVLSAGSLFVLDTVYTAQIVGGLIFGVGFVLGGWCPGTAAAGLGAGKLDALVFLGGALAGGIFFNELFSVMRPVYEGGRAGAAYAHAGLGLSMPVFAFLFTLAAIACFWGCEWIERAMTGRGAYLGTRFLKAFSVLLLLGAAALFAVPAPSTSATASAVPSAAASEQALLAAVDEAQDHVEPEELADRLIAGEPGLVVVDVRSEAEYREFHIRGARHVPLADVPAALAPSKNRGVIVLYSNGMTHPAQARDALQRLGFNNAYILTDGLQGFASRCLKPISLRAGPLAEPAERRVRAWRSHFLSASAGPSATSAAAAASGPPPASPRPEALPANAPIENPSLVSTVWLDGNLGRPDVKVIDLRPTPEYNTSHIPGSLALNVESLRGNVNGVPAMLLPVSLLASLVSLLGIRPADAVVLVHGDKLIDATLAAMAFERLGHRRYAVLDGGFPAWKAEKRAVNNELPSVSPSLYPAPAEPDRFTADAAFVRDQVGRPGGIPILDVRPAENYSGAKSDEARAGHIPGAVNRPFSADVESKGGVVSLKPIAALAAEYAKLFPDRNAPVIVHCRTGHQASQTYFVMKHLLGYRDVRWYDAGWTEWAARPELPVEK